MLSKGRYQGFRLACIVAAAIIAISGHPVQSRSQGKDVESVVRERVTSYFEAWRRGDYEAASNYVHPDSRKIYVFRVPKVAPLTSYKIEKILFNSGKTVCEVTALVHRPHPLLPESSPPFVLENQWQLEPDGQWYLLLPLGTLEKQFGAPVAAEFAKLAAESVGGAPAATPSRFQPDPANPAQLHRGEKGIFKYSYSNTGKTPIKILSAYADCGCASVQGQFPLLAPAESATLEIVFDSFALPLGEIRKAVQVSFSDLNVPMAIEIKINNLPNFTFYPQSVAFGDLKLGSAAERTVLVVNESGRTVKFSAVSKTDPQVAVQLDKYQAGPGETVKVTVRVNPKAKGEILDILTLRVDLEAEPLITIPVGGRVIS
jgi:hypothetical protein